MNTCATSILKNSNDENLHDKYVVVPASKASNNIALACKLHYIDFDKRIRYLLLFILFVYNCIVDRGPIIRDGGFGSYYPVYQRGRVRIILINTTTLIHVPNKDVDFQHHMSMSCLCSSVGGETTTTTTNIANNKQTNISKATLKLLSLCSTFNITYFSKQKLIKTAHVTNKIKHRQ